MKVTTYIINKGQPTQYYGLKNTTDNMVLHDAPNNWKTEKGAIRWAIKKWPGGERVKVISRCKFCARVVNSGHASCRECTKYCMTQCKIAANTSTSWHREPCTTCMHNPYNRKEVRI